MSVTHCPGFFSLHFCFELRLFPSFCTSFCFLCSCASFFVVPFSVVSRSGFCHPCFLPVQHCWCAGHAEDTRILSFCFVLVACELVFVMWESRSQILSFSELHLLLCLQKTGSFPQGFILLSCGMNCSVMSSIEAVSLCGIWCVCASIRHNFMFSRSSNTPKFSSFQDLYHLRQFCGTDVHVARSVASCPRLQPCLFVVPAERSFDSS